MKKVISILIITVMLIAGLFVLTGCGNNETATGGGIFGTSGWNNDKYSTYVPEPTFATLTKNTESETGNFYTGHYYFSLEEEIDMNKVFDYVEELKNAGYTDIKKVTDDTEDVEYYTFRANNPNTKVSVSLTIRNDWISDEPVERVLGINIPK